MNLRSPLRLRLAALSALMLGGPLAVGQEVDLHLTKETVQAHLDAVAADATLEAEAKTRLELSYKSSLQLVDGAARARALHAQFEQERLAAPQRLEEARLELGRPPLEPRRISRDASLGEVESGLRLARAELEALEAEATDMDAEPLRRAERRSAIPAQVAQERQELTVVETEIQAPTTEGRDPRDSEAALVHLRARRSVLQAEIDMLEEELRSYDARSDLMVARRDLLARSIALAKKTVNAWSEAAERLRKSETLKAEREAEAAARAVSKFDPTLTKEAQHNADLAAGRSVFVRRMEALGVLSTETEQRLREVQAAATEAQARDDAAGLAGSVGVLLRKDKAELPRLRDLRRRAGLRKQELADLRLEQIMHEAARTTLASDATFLAEQLGGVDKARRAGVEREAANLAQTRRRYLGQLVKDANDLILKTASIELLERKLIEEVEAFRAFIDERILWIRSGDPVWKADMTSLLAAFAWIASPHNWNAVLSFLLAEALGSPVRLVLTVLALGLLFGSRRRMRGSLATSAELARKHSCTTIQPTWSALRATLVLAAGPPTLVWAIGWYVGAGLEAPEFAKAVSAALRDVALAMLVIQGLRTVCRPDGLGPAHFGWSPERCAGLRRPLRILVAVVAPTLAVALTLEGQTNDDWKQSLGRLCLTAGLLAATLFLRRHGHVRPPSGSLSVRIARIGHLIAVALPAGLVLLALCGYYFTAIHLSDRLLITVGLAVTVTLVHAFASRWLLVVRRRLAIEQARRRRAMKSADDMGEQALEDAQQLDLVSVDQQSREMLRTVIWIAGAIGAWLIWTDVLPALGVLDKVDLWSYTTTGTGEDGGIGVPQRVPVTLGGLLGALVVLAATLLATRNLPGVLEVTLLRRLPIGAGERYAISTVSRYVITLIGLIWAFSAIGIGWSKVQWLVAAVSVGLGFGLQEIFANFVSGLIILGERPIRVGDWTTVGDVSGRVMRIQMRATTIVDRDLRELVVPNKEFVTGRFINWTLSDQTTRVVTTVGVAYGSDTELATEILLEITAGHPDVLKEPPPSVVFREFGDNSLNLDLRFFIKGREIYPAVLDPIHTQIHKRFAAAGIEIAFPQRDLHIRSAPGLERLFASSSVGAPSADLHPTATQE